MSMEKPLTGKIPRERIGAPGAIPSSMLKPTDARARLCGPALTVLNRPLGLPLAQAVRANVSRLK